MAATTQQTQRGARGFCRRESLPPRGPDELRSPSREQPAKDPTINNCRSYARQSVGRIREPRSGDRSYQNKYDSNFPANPNRFFSGGSKATFLCFLRLQMFFALAAAVIAAAPTQAGETDVVPVRWERFAPATQQTEDLQLAARPLLNAARYNLAWAPSGAEREEPGTSRGSSPLRRR